MNWNRFLPALLALLMLPAMNTRALNNCIGVCHPGTVTITNINFDPTNVVCVGTPLFAYLQATITNGYTVYSSSTCPSCDTNNPTYSHGNCYETNALVDYLSNKWEWVFHSVTNKGDGDTTATYTPTNTGVGTVTFIAFFRDGCVTNIQKATKTTNFTARCPEMTNTFLTCIHKPYDGTNAVLLSHGAVFVGGEYQYCYDCADASWYIQEHVTVVSSTSPSILDQQTEPVFLGWSGCCRDDIATTIYQGLTSGYTKVSSQIICLSKNQDDVVSATNANACKYYNTQIIQRNVLSANPLSATVTTSSWGKTNTCSF